MCRCSSTISAGRCTDGGLRREYGTCCTLDDLHDARRVAAAIGIPHYILNLESPLRRSRRLELRARVRRGSHADSLRALQQRAEVRDACSTGRRGSGRGGARHRATTRASSRTTTGRFRLLRGLDHGKDQSYFLFSLTQAQMAQARFPVGELDKDDGAGARATARTARRRQARQPGDLLRARRRLRRRSSSARRPD